ncbi:sugar ABC transporter ATP-binding protein [Salsuginibacillus kocurii]|uniref:sugar ABC transporter ATP-binding protein n=1 Tax=Salsuginibacillus kocurii TaxID=427078 RepID=UPI00035F6943|nr:sugar ABC transporter ATP-binding protein [Salsuginibacillus kocurii]
MNPIIEVENVSKIYPGTRALDQVNVEIYPGEVHTIAGENGAGKSTLMKTLSGAIEPSEGHVKINGEFLTEFSPKVSAEKKISIIYQEFNLVPYLTVYENIMLGKEIKKGPFVDIKQNKKAAQSILDRMKVNIKPEDLVKDLSVAQQQLVEIAKALSQETDVLIMDEPTAALTEEEVKILFELIESLKQENTAIIYISHKFEEIFAISDYVTVLRDGQYIATEPIHELDHDKLIKLMVGRELKLTERTSKYTDEVVLSLKNVTSYGKVKNVSLDLRKGEIVGLAGLLGSGRTELAKTLYGVYPIDEGEVEIVGETFTEITSPNKAIQIGLGLVPEDRKYEGLVLSQSCENNIVLASLDKICKNSVVQASKEKDVANYYKEQLQIKYNAGQNAQELSGGNQQKLVIAKTLATDADILVIDEPTRGVDIGAKQEIYKLMDELLERGKSILMISSEMTEIMNLSDRIAVMNEGELAGILERDEASQEKILHYATLNKSNVGGVS